MAYHDSQSNNDSYYNPSNNTSSGGSLIDSAKSMLGMMAGFAVTHAVVTTALGFASRKLGGAFAASATKTMNKVGVSAEAKAIATRVAGAKTLPQVIGARFEGVGKSYQQLKQGTSGYRNMLDRRDSAIKAARINSPIDAGKMRLASAFESKSMFTAVMARNFGKTVLSGSVIGYGYDAATGQLEHMGVKGDIPLWNLPGHVANYAQYMTKNAGMFAFMGNMGAMANIAGGAIGGAARTFRANNSGFTDMVLKNAQGLSRVNFNGALNTKVTNGVYNASAEFQNNINKSLLAKSINNAKAAGSTLVSTIAPAVRDKMYSSIEKHPSSAAGGAVSNKHHDSFYKEVNRGINTVKQEFKARQERNNTRTSRGTEGFQIVAELERHSLEAGGGLPSKKGGVNNQVMIGAMTQNQNHKQSWIADVMGLKKTTMGDVLSSEYISKLGSNLSNRFNLSKDEQVANMIRGVHVGDTHFNNGRFHVDMNYLNPLLVAKRALGTIAKQNFHFLNKMPMIGRTLSMAGITMSEKLLSSEYKAINMNSPMTGHGWIVQDLNGKSKTISDILAQGGNQDASVTFANNKYFAIKNNQITLLNTQHSMITNAGLSRNGTSEFKKPDRMKYLYDLRQETRHQGTANREVGFMGSVGKLLRGERVGGIFGFMNSAFDFDLVSARNAVDGLKDTMTHNIFNGGINKNKHTQTLDALITGIYGKDPIGSKMEHNAALKALMDTTEQSVFRTLQNKDVQRVLGEKSQKYLNSDMFSNIKGDSFFERELLMHEKTADGMSVLDRLLANNETKALYNYNVHSPKYAKSHIFTERLGHFSQLSARDALETRYVAQAGGMADQIIHPFVAGADELFEKGIINHTQRMSMKIYGATTTAFNTGGATGKGLNGYYENTKMQGVFKTLQKQGLLQQKEFTEFVMTQNLRKPKTMDPKSPISYIMEHDIGNSKIKHIFEDDNSTFAAVHYASEENRTMAILSNVLDVGTERLTNMMGETFGLHRDPYRYGNGALGAAKFLGTRAAQLSVAALAYKSIDAVVATNPMLDNTGLDAGITGGLSNVLAGTHLITSRALNFTGVAGAGRYLEGLMPGFTSSAPGAIAGMALGFNRAPIGMLGNAIGGAIANRMLSAYMPDFTKTYEQLQSEYSGEEEVAMVSGKGWLLGNTPWQGNKVVGWKPNWYVEAQSRWKASDSLYGSEFRKILHEPLPGTGISIGDFVDPYYMERKHFFTRPYPTTGGWQENMPFGLGDLVSGTLGKLFKPNLRMHEEFLKGNNTNELGGVSAMPIPDAMEQHVYMRSAATMNPRMGHVRSTSFMGGYVYGTNGGYGAKGADDFLNNMEDSMGLVGFAANTVRTALSNKSEFTPTLETAGRISSLSRSYYDQNLGGLGTISEAMRRFVQKPDFKKYGINPIPNMLPNSLPGHMLTGDPFQKIMKGELRLPGRAYEKTHDVNFTLPGRASMFGAQEEDIVKYFTGYATPLLKEELDILDEGTTFHKDIQNWLKAENILISAENLFYDVKNDISGHIDGIIQDGLGGQGRRALEIKSINAAGLKKLEGPKYQHVGQLNFYLHESKMSKGTILYVNRDNPSEFKVFEVNYSANRYAKDLEKINKARSVASQMLAKGKQGMSKGFSYSWVDRLNVLADVAPASKEFKEAKSICMQQMKSGILDQRDIQKFNKALEHREATLRDAELYPTRFKGQIMKPGTEANIQSLNTNIRAAAEYSLPERAIGAAWEQLVNTDSSLINKFFAFKDPIQHYKQYNVYGREFAPWTDPWNTWGSPRVNRVLGATDPFTGAMAGAFDAGYLIGGSPMALVGGAVGAMTGTYNMLFNKDNRWIPNKVKKEREINDYYDTLSYYKNSRMSELSEGLVGEDYRKEASETFAGLIASKSTNYTNIYRAAYDSESPYISAWINETNQDKQQEILKIVPGRLGQVLASHWQNEGSKVNTSKIINQISAEMINGSAPEYDMRLMDPGIHTEDIKLKSINNAGLNAHDFGLGWGEQMIRVQDELNNMPTADMSMESNMRTAAVDSGTVRTAIFNILTQNGLSGRVRVFINDHFDGDQNKVTVTLQHNRLQEIRRAVDFRERFM